MRRIATAIAGVASIAALLGCCCTMPAGKAQARPQTQADVAESKVDVAADPKAGGESKPGVGTAGDTGGGNVAGNNAGGTGKVTGSGSGNKTVQVHGYTTKNGTYVQPHMRAAPGAGTGRRR